MLLLREKATRLLAAALVAAFILQGCLTSGRIKSPVPDPGQIKSYTTVRVAANWHRVTKTGVVLEEGDLFSILVTGKVNTNPKNYPGRWQQFGRLRMMLDDQYYGVSPIHRTLEAKHRGEIGFYVWDGDFDHASGRALHPDWYTSNQGKFDVTVIVWKTRNWTYIGDFLKQMETLNPEVENVRRLAAQTERFKKIYQREIETAQEVEKTREQLADLKKSAASQAKQPNPGTPETMGAAALAAADNERDTKLVELKATLRQLEEIQEQLAAEREKSARLSQALENREALEDPAAGDRYAPLVMIATPRDGHRTTASRISLTGVVEDDQGLERIEILINDQLVDAGHSRGLVVTKAPAIRRHEIHQMVSLAPGRNRIRVRVSDTSGRVNETTITVHRMQRDRNIWAVVIGIDRYPRLPGLKYAVKDARAFYQLLVKNNRIPAENITLLTNEAATLTRLRSLLGTQLKQNAGREDMVIIYYAGHGATERDAMSPDGDGLEKYILPHDANPQDLYASALPMREISHILNRIQSERLVFIADACYSGASGGRTVSIEGIRANLSDGFLSRIASGKGRVILTASGANEVSVEDDALQHGVFTFFLIEGLKGRADYDGDGLITVDEAYRFVSEAVPDATAQGQHPVKKGSVEGRLVLGVVQ